MCASVDETPQSNGNESVGEQNTETEIIPKVSEPPIKQYGITSAVNTDPPTRMQFVTYFSSLDILETKEAMNHKLVTLDKLNKLAKCWIVEFLRKQRMPESDARAVGGHIRTFGSYRLGVHTRGGDIDAVLIVPVHIERKDFFESFSTFLKSRSDVKDLRCIPEAYVPLMKFYFCDIEFDLLFCRLKRNKVADDLSFAETEILRDMEIKDIRSINGFRVADEILSLVPSQSNFKVLLHAVKYWAKINQLYSNILGFFGGITWAILAARICQLYPRSAPSVLINKDWKNHPVVLKRITYTPCGLTLPQWHISATDQNPFMSIITPTYPEQNTVHNVTYSTRTVITERLNAAYKITEDILDRKSTWADLFVPYNFFQSYLHFLVLSAHSGNDKKILEFHGFVESKLRLLVTALEKNIFISVAHPHCKSYPALPSENIPNTRRWFIGLSITKPEEGARLKIDLNEEIAWFTNELLVKSKSSYYYPEKTVTFNHLKRKDLPNYLPLDVIGQPVKRLKTAAKPSVILKTESLENLQPILLQKRKLEISHISSEPSPKSLPEIINGQHLNLNNTQNIILKTIKEDPNKTIKD